MHPAVNSVIQQARHLDWLSKEKRRLHDYDTLQQRTCISIVNCIVRICNIQLNKAGYYAENDNRLDFYVFKICVASRFASGKNAYTLEQLALIGYRNRMLPEEMLPMYKRYDAPEAMGRFLIAKTDCMGNVIDMKNWTKVFL